MFLDPEIHNRFPGGIHHRIPQQQTMATSQEPHHQIVFNMTPQQQQQMVSPGIPSQQQLSQPVLPPTLGSQISVNCQQPSSIPINAAPIQQPGTGPTNIDLGMR